MIPAAPVQTIPTALIDAPAHALREHIDPEGVAELADSMAAEGLHQPIGVRQTPATGRYEIIWGHRRLLAARLLQWEHIEARVFASTFDPLLAAVSENLQRADLTPVEEANAVQQMLARGHSQASVARMFRRSLGWVHTRLALLQLPSDLQAAVHDGRLAIAIAQALGEIDHEGYRQELIAEAVRTGANGATAGLWVAHYKLDGARLLQNRARVDEVLAAKASFKVYYPCDACGVETPYEGTRALRFCATCAKDFGAAIQAARGLDNPAT